MFDRHKCQLYYARKLYTLYHCNISCLFVVFGRNINLAEVFSLNL
jgi:hypothetical protein